ncbi:UNVERIFIED_CONTAM: hypothetical protein Scaly_0949900 [Sesamum calycinum]|uniref:DUF4228 domain-containing protein n=1 Tax=Sesamum calycinum TaxID=2727403 RepID=A0AAW2QYZ0_9LAMI
MGNFISCTFVAPKLRSPKSARVILPGGEIRQFRQPVKAAELMLDSPNFFLVNSKSLNIGRRFSPLSADEDLEFGNLYVMIPMRRVNSVVTAAEVAVFLMAANSAPKRISGGNYSMKVSPEAAASPGDDSKRVNDRGGNGGSAGGTGGKGGGGGVSHGNSGTMKAPGGGGAYISRPGFESDPKGYFSGLHSSQKGK